MKIIIINGPNLNLLGSREPHIYGSVSFDDYLQTLRNAFPEIDIDHYQSNIEGEIIDRIQASNNNYDAILLNPAGYTHTSISIADTVASVAIPVIEIHISSILSREPFRSNSLVAPHCIGTVMGFGLDSYKIGILSAVNHLKKSTH